MGSSADMSSESKSEAHAPSDAIGAITYRKSSSLGAIVQIEIERMIVSGDFEAGQRLNEQQLAARLGVSRGPVREALRALERVGLVTGIANLGMFVRQIGIEEAIEMYEMRAVVFGFACFRLAGSATPKQHGALHDHVAHMDEAIAQRDSSAYFRLNLDFHDLVMDYSGHGRATKIYQSLVKEGRLLRARSLQPVASMRASNGEHKKILELIAAGDGRAARAAAEEHHLEGKRRWLETLGQ